MRLFSSFLTLALLASQINGVASDCPDPLAAIMETLDCVTAKDVACASAGYNAEKFVKIHNGIDTNTVIDSGGAYWSGAFALIDIYLDYDHKMNIGPNQASVRYVEKVVFTDGSSFGLPPSSEYPYGSVVYQHEHALVTVDDDCKMIRWDQYGDNAEQKEVDDIVLLILCDIGFYPPEICPGSGTPTSAPTVTRKKSKKPKKSKKKKKKKVKK